MCNYQTTELSSSALAKYNDAFSNNKTVDVAQFMVYSVDPRTIPSMEVLNFKLPNTARLPNLCMLELKNRDDYNHTSARSNFYNSEK